MDARIVISVTQKCGDAPCPKSDRDLSEHSESAIGGQDSQVSEVWSQETETFDEPGEDNAAPPLGRAGKSETNTVGDDEDAARHQDGPSGSAVMAPRAHSSRRARSSGWGGSLT